MGTTETKERLTAARIVNMIEFELNDRRGLHWSDIDEDTLADLKISLTDDVERILRGEQTRYDKIRSKR